MSTILIQIIMILLPGIITAILYSILFKRDLDTQAFLSLCSRFSLAEFLLFSIILSLTGNRDFLWVFFSLSFIIKAWIIYALLIVSILILIWIYEKYIRKHLVDKRKVLKFLSVFISLLVITALSVKITTRCLREAEINKVRSLIASERYIIHAAGALPGKNGEKKQTYTNSPEALENAYENGHRIMEIDFLFSSDGYLLCSHEWNELYQDGELVTDTPVTKDRFLKLKRYNEFRTMWLGDLVDYMRKHPDLYIITDISGGNEEGCRQIAQYCPDLKDRFIIQIYHEFEYDLVSDLGFKYIIYTLFGTQEEERTPLKLLQASKYHSLVGYTFWYYWADEPDFLSSVKKTGLPLYIHTVTDRKEEERYFDMGISAIYTDDAEADHF